MRFRPMKKYNIILLLIALLCIGLLCSCQSIPKNTVHTAEDLEGKTIGVKLKTTGDVYATEIEGATVQRFNTAEDAVIALKDGTIDAVILDDGPATVFVDYYEGIRILDEAYAEEEYGIVIKKGNQELLDKINDALKTIKENGTLDAITQNWIYEGSTESAYEGQNKESYANGKLIVATNAEFPPYESVIDDEIVGYDIDMMKAICDVLDMELVLQDMAFDSVISSVEEGIVDVAASGMSITEERMKQVDFSEPYITAKQVIIVREDEK